VIAIAEIKYVLKTSGENFKAKVGHIEDASIETFAHDHAHIAPADHGRSSAMGDH
jgi:molybdopterin-containing oxidoreductase family membrane subunit